MNKKNIALVIVSVTLLVVIICSFSAATGEKTGYVELNKLFEDFQLKKELQAQLSQIKTSRKNILDSLEFQLKIMAKQIQAENQKDQEKVASFEIKKENFFEKKRQFEEDNEAVTKQYDAQIISQLSQYVKDYGEKYSYTYIFGADGSGFLMFSMQQKNITEDVKKFINERYKGKVE
jgi:outer membrane protein